MAWKVLDTHRIAWYRSGIMSNQYLRIVVTVQIHERLQKLADLDRRTLGAEAAWLIDQELNRRGIDLGTLQPVVVTETCATNSTAPSGGQS